MAFPEFVLSLGLGLVLAACCGLRAFLPLFIVSALEASGQVNLPTELVWMGSPLALACFGTAMVFEVAADKIPVLDHFMDGIGTLIRPIAGSAAVLTLMQEATPLLACVFALIAGGVVAGGVHLGKAATRAGATATTGGLANPILSVAEDVLVLGFGGAAAVIALMA